MKTKRIALISEHASPLATLGGVDSGGQNVYVGQIARRLPALGYEVDVFTRRDRADLDETVRWADGARIVHVPAGPAAMVRKEDLLPHMGEFAASMVRRIRAGRPYDLVHANFFMSALVAAELKLRRGYPVCRDLPRAGRVRRLHQGGEDSFPHERLAIEDRVVREADADHRRVPAGRRRPGRALRRRPVAAGDDPVRLRSRRVLADGQGPRPRACSASTRMSESSCNSAGWSRARGWTTRSAAWPGSAAATASSAAAGRRRRVARPRPSADARDRPVDDHRAGRGRGRLGHLHRQPGRDELRYYYCAADIFVTTPWYEPFGITPVEAAACGTPIVGASVGGIKTTVVDGETGYLVPPRDPDAIADRLARLFGRPELIRLFGRQGARRAASHFTWGSVARDIAGLYDELIAYRSPRSLVRFGAGSNSGRRAVAVRPFPSIAALPQLTLVREEVESR